MHARYTAPRFVTLAALAALTGCWELRPASDRRDAGPAEELGPMDVPTDTPPDAADERAAIDDAPAESGADASADATAAVDADAGPDADADAAADADADADAAPDADAAADADAGPDADAALDADAADARPDIAPDVTPDLAPDAPPDVTPDAAPDVTPDAAPDAGPPTVPLPILPPSGGRVLRSLPTFELDVPAGADGLLIEVCATSTCASVIRSLTVARTAQRVRARLSGAALADGRYWWRAHAMSGATRVSTSATWRFRLTARAGAADAVGPDPLDVDSNGVNDFVAVCGGQTQLYLGGMYFSPAFLGPTGVTLRGRLTATGDFNGDGFGDVAAIAPNGAADARVLQVFLGRATGLSSTPWAMPFTSDAEVRWLGAAGDFNRDGYADLALDRVGATPPLRQVTVVYGGPNGLRLGPSLQDLAPMSAYVGAANVGDYNNDGYEDLAVGVPGALGGDFERAARVFTGGRFGPLDAVATYTFLGTPRSGGDVNGDGVFDIIATQEAGTALVVGTPAALTPFTSQPLPAMAAGDFNADGIDDVFFGGRLAMGNPFIGTFMGRTATGFRSAASGIQSAESNAADLVDGVQWGLYDGDLNPDALLHLEETVGGARRGSFRVYRSGSGIIYTSPVALSLLDCSNLIAW